ncbi:MAG: hypothetical protein ABIJ17_01120 [Patescibacteria group bacterium]
MNIKKLLVLILVFFISLGIFSQEYKEFYKIGIAPYRDRELKNKNELIYLLQTKSNEIVNLFASYLDASSSSIAIGLSQIADEIDIREDYIGTGDTIEGMIWKSKKNGEVMITNNIRWMGKVPIECYSFALIYGNKIFYFKVPKLCGNVSLMRVEIREPEKTPEEVAIEEIKEAFIQSPPPPPPRPQKVEKRPEYKTAYHPVEKTYKYAFFADIAGGLYRGCHQKYVVGRIGLGPIEDGWGLNLIGGVSFPIEKDEPQWKNVFLFDGLLVYRKEIFRGGIGIGLATQMTDLKPNQTEIVVNATIMIKRNIGLFIEGRTPINRSNNETIVENNKILFGLRFF